MTGCQERSQAPTVGQHGLGVEERPVARLELAAPSDHRPGFVLCVYRAAYRGVQRLAAPYPELHLAPVHVDGATWSSPTEATPQRSPLEMDNRIILSDRSPFRESVDMTVEHPDQPADYVRTDGTRWTWRDRWRPVGGVIDERGGRRGGTRIRVYDLVT